jgi:sterol desaturase/sphingolipid hydroxylase (fatty acid hydroxylase superfamily)
MLYRGIWRAHRLHHYRNEQYWFGVTMHLADHVLRTYPEKDAVPASATARTLGVDGSW